MINAPMKIEILFPDFLFKGYLEEGMQARDFLMAVNQDGDAVHELIFRGCPIRQQELTFSLI